VAHEHVYERRAGDASAALPRGYHRREPEKTVLYQAMQAHLATFLAELQAWYWYELVGSGVTDGQEAGVCVGCHQLPGSDSERSGHDFVYTQVRP